MEKGWKCRKVIGERSHHSHFTENTFFLMKNCVLLSGITKNMLPENISNVITVGTYDMLNLHNQLML